MKSISNVFLTQTFIYANIVTVLPKVVTFLVWEIGKRDIELLEKLETKNRGKLAEELKISPNALNQRIHRIRTRKLRYRWYVNNIIVIEKRSPHIKRMLLPTRPKFEEEEEW